MSSAPSPFTAEHIAEWKSFGPRLKGKPTPEERAAAQERKLQCTAMKKRLAAEIDNVAWTEKKIEKELDRLVEAGEHAASSVVRPSFLDGPSGTRDFYPSDMRLRNWLFGHFRATALQFGFEEYDAPVLEHVPLYERKAGEEIVTQMYHFHDPEGAHVTLRPEMTPSLARLVLNKTELETGTVRLTLPLKWYSIPQCWRFETTQRGRRREHYQWNMDMVGVPHQHAELELLAAAASFFQRVGLTPEHVGIKVNSRTVLEALLAKYGIANTKQAGSGGGASDNNDSDASIFPKACVIIDKLDKIGGEAVICMLGEIGVPEASARDILQALQAPTIEALAEIVGNDGDSSNSAIQQMQRLFALAESYGIADYLVFDASVVRGLAYYTGIVWEAFDRKGQLRAIMGGGRYDRLLELYGGPQCQVPCVGFGFGDCVIVELLAECGLLPSTAVLERDTIDYVVCAFNDELYGTAARVTAGLRQLNNNTTKVDLMPTPKKKVKDSFKYADDKGARRMVFVAPDEVARNVIRIKDLRTQGANQQGLQVDVPIDDLAQVDALFLAAAQAQE